MPSFLEVVFPVMNGLLLWGVLHLMRLSVAGNHWLFIGVLPGSHGMNAGILGTLFWPGGKSQLILFWMGPAPLSILGFEEGGLRFSSSRRSVLGRGINALEDSLDRGGTSSSDLVGVLSGNFIGEMFLLGLLDSLLFVFAICPLSLSPEGPGFGSLESLSFLEECWLLFWLLGPELESLVGPSSGCPGIGVLFRVSGSENLMFVSSSSEGSTSPSSFESLESEVSLSSSLLPLSLVMEDFSLLTTHFLISSLDTREFAFLGILFSGEAEPVLLFGLMKFLRSSFLPSLNFEYLRSEGPDLRGQVSLRSLWFLYLGVLFFRAWV